MSDDLHRRRRLGPSGPRRPRDTGSNAWLITAAAALGVIIGGWFLGQGLAHWLSPAKEQVAQGPTPAPIAASPVASPTIASQASPQPSPTVPPSSAPETAPPTPRRTEPPTARPTIRPTQVPTNPPTAAPTAAPTTAPTAAATRTATAPPRTTLPVARRPQASPAAAPPAPVSAGPAAQTVVSYINALRRGDPQSAGTYLGNGSPDESFIDANTEIYSVASARNADGSYTVTAHLHTPKGAYTETFTVAPTSGGSKILDKSFAGPPQ